MCCIQDPAAAIVIQHTEKRGLTTSGRSLDPRRRHACLGQTCPDERTQRLHARGIPGLRALVSHPLKAPVYDRTHMADGFLRPGKLDLRRSRSDRQCVPRIPDYGRRRIGQPPVSRQTAQQPDRRPAWIRRDRLRHPCTLRPGTRKFLFHRRPQPRQQRSAVRHPHDRSLIPVGDVHMSQQMQVLDRARRGHIKQPPFLTEVFLPLEFHQIPEDRIGIGTTRTDRCQQQVDLIASRIRPLRPDQQGLFRGTRGASESRHDYGSELQALRLVNRHELQLLSGFHVRQRKQRLHPRSQIIGIPDISASGAFLEQIEIDKCIGKIRASGTAGRTTKRDPRSFDKTPERLASSERDAPSKRRAQPAGAVTAIVAAAPDAIQRLYALPDGLSRGSGHRLEVRKRQSAPGRTQHRQPGKPVTRMHQCTRQRKQILHDAPVSERFNLDSPKAQTPCTQPCGNCCQMATRAHENCHRFPGRSTHGFSSQGGDHIRLARVITTEKRVHGHR